MDSIDVGYICGCILFASADRGVQSCGWLVLIAVCLIHAYYGFFA